MSSWELREGDAITDELTAVRRLGGGATYEAYLAFDEVTWGPVVAKVVRPDLVEDAPSLRGLRREAAALAAVSHPVVVRAPRSCGVVGDSSRSSTCRWASSWRRRCTTCATSAGCTWTSSRRTRSWARRRG